MLIIATVFTSCSREIYNNKEYLSSHNLEGKKLAVLPVEVFYSGQRPAKADWYAEEQTASLNLQADIAQTFLAYKNEHERKNQQFKVKLMSADTVNNKLYTKMMDLRTAWTMAPDSVGRMVGADLVLKVRMNRERYMSEKAANWANAGFFVLNGLLGNEYNPEAFGYVKASDTDYEISLIDTKTGEVISRYNPNQQNRQKIKKINKLMASKSVVFAGE